MKKFLIGGVAAAALVIGSAALADTAQPAKAGAKGHDAHAMKAATRAEVQAHVATAFAKLDANHDGFVTADEMNARVERREQRAEQRAARFDPSKVFDRMDADRDGKITGTEAEAARNHYVQAKDGKSAQAHATAIGGLFARADTNKDGVVSRAEFDTIGKQMKDRMAQAGMKRGGMAGRLFAASDTNKDSRVSLAEMQQAALARFDRGDLNHDGKITPEERQQKRQQRKAQRQPG